MGAPRSGLNPTTNSVGFTAKLVTVRSVTGSVAIVVDRQNTQTSVPMLVQRGKGPLPAPGDTWLIAQDLGMWTFAAFVGKSEGDFAEGGLSGSQVTIGPDPPTSPTADDVWFDSSNGNQLSAWDGTQWVAAQFGTAALADGSVTAAKLAPGTITSSEIAPAAGILASQVAFTASQIGGSRVFTGTAQPSGMTDGDLWFDSGSDNSVSVWTGEGWNSLPLGALAIAPSSLTGAQLADDASIAASQVDFTASDIGGVTVSIDAEAPAGPAVGDLWYDSTNGYVLKQWNGSEWALYKYGTGAISAGAVTAELIAANTITAAQIAAGIVLAGVVDGTVIEGATFLGTNWVENELGSFYYSGPPVAGNLIASVAPVGGADPDGNAYVAGTVTYNQSQHVAVALLDGNVIFYTSVTYAGPWSQGPTIQGSGASLQIHTASAELDIGPSAITASVGILAVGGVYATEPGSSGGVIESWHSLGTAGSTGCTLLTAQYKLSPDGNFCVIDIALQAPSGGSTAGTYTWSNTLPSAYQFAGNFLRNYPLAFNANITTGTENACVVVDGNGTATPGRVRMTLPAVSNAYFTATCFVPII